ncbi:hypothetical protein FISHEDRAFT_22424, partial [Fistulina hepatica ATCC 64428]
MSISFNVVPTFDRLRMYGNPDTSTAYALSGHVEVTVSHRTSIFHAPRRACFLLQSLSLVFEGQAETVVPGLGYVACRICHITRELISSPVELSSDDQANDGVCRYNITFNIPVNGWIPESCQYGEAGVGNSYALHAHATFMDISDSSALSSFASFCRPFRGRLASADASQVITVQRFVNHPCTLRYEPPQITYPLPIPSQDTYNAASGNIIPYGMLSRIQMSVSLPSFLDIKETMTKLTLRLRLEDLSESDRRRLSIETLGVDLRQRETNRSEPSPLYTSAFPMCPPSMQPPDMPLLNPHPIAAAYDLGLLLPPLETDSGESRSFSLLPSHEQGILSMNRSVGIAKSYNLEVTVYYSKDHSSDATHYAGPCTLRPSGSGPLLSVHHQLLVMLALAYDLPNGEKARATLRFAIPLRFGRFAPPLTPMAITQLNGATVAAESTSITMPPVLSYLPAYSRLFSADGDCKFDYNDPSPQY